MTVCNFCGSDRTRPVHMLRDWHLNLPGEFTLVQCQVCGLMYLDPRPEWPELLRHYPDEYAPYSKQPSTSGLRRFGLRHGLRRRCRAIARCQPAGRLLDVGCATGSFLQEVRRYGGWEPFGVEPVPAAATFARDQLGLTVFTGTLEEARFEDGVFDVITFWHVLEHVEDPKRTLGEAYRILRPGGWLVVQLPDPQSWQARWFGKYWAGFDAPRHLYDFPPTTLRQQFIQLGWGEIQTRALQGGNAAFWLSLRAKLSDTNPSSGSLRLVQSPLLPRLATPMFAVLRWLGQGASVTYFCRKPMMSVVGPQR